MKLSSAIIGLGNISLLFDDDPSTPTILSHAKALYKSTYFDLKYCFDVDTTNENSIKKFFPQVEFFTDLSLLKQFKDIKLIILATPTSTHLKIFEEIQNLSHIKYFLIEKPLFENVFDLNFISKDITKKIIINYIRIFEPNVQKLHMQIQKEELGVPQKLLLSYTKGIKNNGSHFISLINFLFENPSTEDITILNSQKESEDDPTLDLIAYIAYKNKKIPVFFIGLDHNQYSVFDIEIYFDRGKVHIDDTKQKLTYYKATKDKTYEKYITLQETSNVTLNYDTIMQYPYKYIEQLIENKLPSIDFIEHEKSNIQFFTKLEDNKES